jgi:hypothetical protein
MMKVPFLTPSFVIPAKAGTQGLGARGLPLWVTAFAGMTRFAVKSGVR